MPVGIVILDRMTKILAELYVKDLDHPVTVIKGCLNLIYLTNRGALFGFGHTQSSHFRFIALTAVPLLIVGVIIFILIKARPDEKVLSTGMSFILGGAIGNLIDRLFYGEVIDFLDFYIRGHHWYTFNLADSFISIGIVLILFEMIFKRK